MEFYALVGSLINYEIVLITRDVRAKHGKALKASTHSRKEESERDTSVDEKEDEQLKFYSKRTYKKLLKNKKNQQKEMERLKTKKK